jgi:site-specific DNA-methyltransferase (adenine-specific)
LPEKKKWLKGGTGTGISDRENIVARNNHPTVKPLMLMSYLITLGSQKGDTILEPFMGSGTTCMAALILKRKFIGIERQKEYFEIAKARITGISKLIKEGNEKEIKKVLKIK